MTSGLWQSPDDARPVAAVVAWAQSLYKEVIMGSWARPMYSVMETLCEKQRITLRKNQPRWHRVLRACDRFLKVMQSQPELSVPADILLASHSAKVMAFALLMREAADNAATRSLTHSLASGNWSIEVFRVAIDRVVAAAENEDKHDCQDGSVLQEQGSGEDKDTELRSDVAAGAAVVGMATGSSAVSVSAEMQTATQCATGDMADPFRMKRQRTAETLVPGETLDVLVAPLQMPEPVSGVAGVPHALVELLKIARVLNSDKLVCEEARVENDGSVVLGMRNRATRHTLSAVQMLRFSNVFALQELRRASEALILPSGEESALSVSWKQRLAQENLMATLWMPLPPDFVDSSSIRAALDMPFPSIAQRQTIAFHPLLRFHEDVWNAFHLTVIGHSSDAMIILLRSGALATLDASAVMTMVATLIDDHQFKVACDVIDVSGEMIRLIRASPRNQEIAMFGDMSAVMKMLPINMMMNTLISLKARADRKMGATDPAALARAEEAYRTWKEQEVIMLETLTSFAKNLITEVQIRAMGVSEDVFHALDDHFGFTAIFHAACKLGRLWNAAERFAMMRHAKESAATVFDYGLQCFHPGTAVFKWKLSEAVDDLPPLNMPPDHIHITFATKQYARAIAEASDATVAHLEDALIKAEHAYKSRLTHLGSNSRPTDKAKEVLTVVRARLDGVRARDAASVVS